MSKIDMLEDTVARLEGKLGAANVRIAELETTILALYQLNLDNVQEYWKHLNTILDRTALDKQLVEREARLRAEVKID